MQRGRPAQTRARTFPAKVTALPEKRSSPPQQQVITVLNAVWKIHRRKSLATHLSTGFSVTSVNFGTTHVVLATMQQTTVGRSHAYDAHDRKFRSAILLRKSLTMV